MTTTIQLWEKEKIDPKILKRVANKKFRSLNQAEKSFRARSLLALFIAQDGRSRFNLLINFGDDRLRYIKSDDFVELALHLKENHANEIYIHEDAEFHCFYIEDGELVGMGFMIPSEAYTNFMEMVERAEDIYTRQIFNLFIDVFGEEDFYTALIEGEDSIQLLFETFLEGHAEFLDKVKEKQQKDLVKLMEDEENDNEIMECITTAVDNSLKETRQKKGDLKQILKNIPAPPQATTNLAGIKIKPEPTKVKEWDELYGKFRKYFKNGKLIVKGKNNKKR